jgi:glycosyltransferase involved in cell wall biosynthesis
MKLSVCMCVHNEAEHLAACLDTVKFADEIVIALDKCTDNSKQVALSYGAKIIEGDWPLEGDRRNAVVDMATGDWILELDCDERVTPALAEEIRHTVNTSPYYLHAIPFDNYIGDRLVKYGWGAYIGVSHKGAFFRKGAKRAEENGKVTHVKQIFVGEHGAPLKNAIIHYMDKDFSATLRRFDGYTKAGAQDLLNKGELGTFWRNFRRIFSRFYKSYIRRKGYREGSLGFVIGMLAGMYPMISYVRAKYRLL